MGLLSGVAAVRRCGPFRVTRRGTLLSTPGLMLANSSCCRRNCTAASRVREGANKGWCAVPCDLLMSITSRGCLSSLRPLVTVVGVRVDHLAGESVAVGRPRDVQTSGDAASTDPVSVGEPRIVLFPRNGFTQALHAPARRRGDLEVIDVAALVNALLR